MVMCVTIRLQRLGTLGNDYEDWMSVITIAPGASKISMRKTQAEGKPAGSVGVWCLVGAAVHHYAAPLTQPQTPPFYS